MSRFRLQPSQELIVAERLSWHTHKGQVDKSGVDYIKHVEGVVNGLHGDEDKTVGWLHDTIEDGDVTSEALVKLGFSDSTIETVVLLTRKRLPDGNYAMPYEDYIRSLQGNERAVRVKVADLKNNIGRLHQLAETDELKASSLQKRYMKALFILTGSNGL